MTFKRDLSDLRVELVTLQKRKNELTEKVLNVVTAAAVKAIEDMPEDGDEDEVIEDQIRDVLYDSDVNEYLGGDVLVYHNGVEVVVEFEEWESSHC
ncbi:hypothetical protein CPT_Mendera_125 [Stenotrophomonas phage Mendera]|uniref:Uncharacterized protein n=3 Tax=Menderavirus TaxID=2843421 RepID=A0A5P8PMH5_9CAUD|nr:hypothetical protein HWC58_gp254 [Stenotrophomonas phage Moby]YP_009851179.1 hypothetical protein HWC60_gp270 [Stenotrophomonas phage Mendera]YP_010667695.1 hypothetical protein PQC01_gp262 [Stenotrophomonas maltophilia phage vB_SmaM_Ps15]QXN67226.1 hypothetical protein [Stenotrophomonas phage BUCT608]QYW02667.1 hypothetical protein CPT_Marzo_129 [Stenotrophomonas phage Marzo]QFR56671.1 hypothetical protein CPT_Mendera_125 [Stenotrophomonas phage Mendera]QFR57869.1 hypothetical protein CPT